MKDHAPRVGEPVEVDGVGQVNLENRAQDCEEDQYRQSCQSDPEANARSLPCVSLCCCPAIPSP